MPSTLWLELRALSGEVWSRSLEETEGWARQAGKGGKPGCEVKDSTGELPSQEKPSLKPILREPNSASRSTLHNSPCRFLLPKVSRDITAGHHGGAPRQFSGKHKR